MPAMSNTQTTQQTVIHLQESGIFMWRLSLWDLCRLVSRLPQRRNFAITKKIPIPGQGSWDYLTVDEGARRLYVSHGTQVEVLDVDSGAIVGKIENTPGVHGIAIAPELGRGFVSNGQSSTVTIFDLKTLKTIARGSGRQETRRDHLRSCHVASLRIQWRQQQRHCHRGGDRERWREQSISAVVPSLPWPMVRDMFTIIVEDASLVLKINARSLKVEQRWPTAPCASPSSMAMDRPNRRLFIGCRSKVMAVMNADTGQVITTLPIGDHVDATAFDPDSRLDLQFQRRRHHHGDSPGQSGQILGCRNREDLAQGENHGARSENASSLPVHSGSGTI